MVEGPNVITPNSRVWIQTPVQAPSPASITAVEEGLFWTTLPLEGSQVLVLQPGDLVQIGVTMTDGYYTAQTEVKAVAEDSKRFYGLAMPKEFIKTQHRQFTRLDAAVNVLFRAGDLSAQSTLVNISSGGIMVYLVPDLKAIVQAGQAIRAQFHLDGISFDLPVKPAWRKKYRDIPFAGFKFMQSPPALRLKMAELCLLKQPEKK